MPYKEECGIFSIIINCSFIGKNHATCLPDSEKGHALSFVSLTTSSKSLKVCFIFLSPIIFNHSELTHGQLLFGVSQSFLSCVFRQSLTRKLQEDFVKKYVRLQQAYYSSTWHSENQISQFSNCVISRLRVSDDTDHSGRTLETRVPSTDSTTSCKQAPLF